MSNGRAEVDRLEQEVDQIRGNIGALIRELNHRRHSAGSTKQSFTRGLLPNGSRTSLYGAALRVSKQRKHNDHERC